MKSAKKDTSWMGVQLTLFDDLDDVETEPCTEPEEDDSE